MPRQIEKKNIRGVGDYIDRLYKIIPAELTAAYVAAQSFLGVPPDAKDNIPLLVGFGLFITALVPFYLAKLQNVTNRSQIIVSTVSFPIWAANISTTYVAIIASDFWVKALGLILIGWVLATPVLVGTKR